MSYVHQLAIHLLENEKKWYSHDPEAAKKISSLQASIELLRSQQHVTILEMAADRPTPDSPADDDAGRSVNQV